ncbi:beta-lactamase [Uncinocarpus reesii 1704]|uniref:Beta-lactamase n=1 Tax=Uncinocarpus reesii (strain UAMH 1704) TaxID=336963 RepID=C4JKD0_UNCRE|nr:beta-lactamase [Uncinocarpus reesii 1704]EEP77238.1 beta-lactamase [Uncinocarpus reesii 1704]
MGKTLSPEGQAAIRAAIDEACKDQTQGLPNVAFVVVNKDGQEILAHAAGTRGIGQDEPATPDSVYWIASFTKMITGVACMHFYRDNLRDQNYDEFCARFDDFMQPLVNQPGETWEYGINIDWAGIMVERVTGVPLSEYFQKSIFEPLGLNDIGFFPSEAMKKRLISMTQRAQDGTLSQGHHPNHMPLDEFNEDEKKFIFNSGGGGCFSTPRDYAQLLAALLNNGVSPTTGNQILSKSTVDSMFENQIPHMPDFGRAGLPAAKPDLTNPVQELYPLPDRTPQGWGLTWMITPSPTGRTATSAFWAGIANCFWWCDREKGIAGVITTQVLPFGDPKLVPLWVNIEAAVYNSLI